MSGDTYSIDLRRGESGKADVLVYGGAGGHSIEFHCSAATAPASVWIPRGRWWLERVPPWAQPQRERIVDRVRTWGAIVHETEPSADGGSVTTIESPDRSFRIECSVEPDERTAPWERTRLIANPGGEVLIDLPLHALGEGLAFPRDGAVTMSLVGRYGDRRRVHIDITQRRFRVDGDPESIDHPLHVLGSMLAPVPQPARAYASIPSRRQAGFDLLIGALGLPFALGGLWLAVIAKTASDRLAGIAGLVLGGLAAISSLRDWRRRRALRNNPASGALIRLLPYLPLLAVAAEVVWLGLLLLAFVFTIGDSRYVHTPGSPAVRLWDLIAMLPALAGLAAAAACLARGTAHGSAQWSCLLFGIAGCVAFVALFGHELLH